MSWFWSLVTEEMAGSLTELKNFERGTDLVGEGHLGPEEKREEAGDVSTGCAAVASWRWSSTCELRRRFQQAAPQLPGPPSSTGAAQVLHPSTGLQGRCRDRKDRDDTHTPG